MSTEPDDDERRFRENMKLQRNIEGWSQGELSGRLIDAGYPIFYQTTISRIENGTRPVKLGEARAIASIFNLPLDDMLGAPEIRRFEQELSDAKDAHQRAYGGIRGGVVKFLHSKERLRVALRDPMALNRFGSSELDELSHEVGWTIANAVEEGENLFREGYVARDLKNRHGEVETSFSRRTPRRPDNGEHQEEG